MRKPRYVKLGLSELAYNMAFTSGYQAACWPNPLKCEHPRGTPGWKAWHDGWRACKGGR